MGIASIGFGVAAIYTIGSRKAKSDSQPPPPGWGRYRSCFSGITSTDAELDAIVSSQESIRGWAKHVGLDENYLNAIAWLQSRMGTAWPGSGRVGMFAIPAGYVRNLLNSEGLVRMDVAAAAAPDVNTRIASLLLSNEKDEFEDPYLAYLSLIAGRQYTNDAVASAEGGDWYAQINDGSVRVKVEGLEKTWADFVDAEQKAANGQC